MSVTIYGASDDLIEIRGDVEEEYGGGGEAGDVLMCSDGTALRVRRVDGIWRVTVEAQGTGEVTIERAPDEYDEDGDNTDRATIAGPIAWVLTADAFTLGEVAYSGYFVACSGKSLISGAELPSWDEQSVQIRAAWVAAAEAVRAKVNG